MVRNVRFFFFLGMFALIASAPARSAVRTTTKWSHTGEEIYNTGFMRMLMKSGDGGVKLFNMELVENDSPGSGYSEKGCFGDDIWGAVHGRKIFRLEDPRTEKAWLVFFTNFWTDEGYLGRGRPEEGIGKYPLKITVNGNQIELKNWDIPGNGTGFRWIDFPAEWLKKGDNLIDFSCPEAANSAEGWSIALSRADEFPDGGGDPKDVGKTSFKSFDGGKSWKESPFGPARNDRCEYSIRLSLDRSVPTGWLASPVIDLWKGDADLPIVPIRAVYTMKLSIRSDVPEGTQVEYWFRKGRDPGPEAGEWSEYRLIGKGPSVDLELDRNGLNRRYIQFKAVLSTANPLRSPVVRSAEVTCQVYQPVPTPENIHVLSTDNASIKYSSAGWEWEKWDRPEFQTLRKIESLDEIIEGARTELAVQARLMEHATKRWRNNEPLPEYPGWDALGIVNHINDNGGGGMCIQLNLALAGFCMAYGFQGRLVNIVGHEVCEVWNDDHAKWIYLEASASNHFLCDPLTIEPLSMLDLHRMYTEYFFPDKPIDWMNDLVRNRPIREKDPPKLIRSTSTEHDFSIKGFHQSAFLFMAPRNNWYEKPAPRPLTSGRAAWPWCGYIQWYDGKTPPMRQHSWYTDRPRDMWPDLNKVHIDATTGFGSDRIFLWFETYTPNFSHFEVNVDGSGWKQAEERFAWILQPGRNSIAVRAVNRLGAKGYPSAMTLNHAEVKFGE